MDRRQFVGAAAVGLAAVGSGRARAAASLRPTAGDAVPAGPLLLADAHAHPYQLHDSRTHDVTTPTLVDLRLVANASDIRSLTAAPAIPWGLLAIEGGDALEGEVANLDRFHDQSVRLLTLVRDRDNEIGYHQHSGFDGPLTRFGVQLVERMNARGMVVDVAHAKRETVKSIAEVSARSLTSIASLPDLIAAMGEAGLSAQDIAAFAGGNLPRLLDRCLA